MNLWLSRVRTAFLLLLLATGLFLIGGFAWLTRVPEAPFLLALERETLERSPRLGRALRRTRLQYLEPPTSAEAGATDRATGDDPPPPAPLPQVYIGGGTTLRKSPIGSAPVIARVVHLRQVAVLERRGSWARIDWASDDQVWVDLDEPPPSVPPLGEAVAPPVPLLPRPPDEDLLAAVREALGPEPGEGRLGPYTVVHDLGSEAARLVPLAHSASRAEAVYRERYAVEPLGEPQEVVAIFRERPAYLAFQDRTADIRGLESAGHVVGGLVVLATAEPIEMESSFIHELGHLLNRRALGPALPPWLDEGMAEDLSHFGLPSAEGASRAQRLESFRQVDGRQVRMGGPLASLAILDRAVTKAELLALRDLAALDWESFVGAGASLHYAQAGWFITWLIEGDDGRWRAGFLRFLANVASGGAPTVHHLADEVGLELHDLELRFRGFLANERDALDAGGPIMLPE